MAYSEMSRASTSDTMLSTPELRFTWIASVHLPSTVSPSHILSRGQHRKA